MSRAAFAVAGAVLTMLVGCATAKNDGVSGNVTWHLTDLRTEERDAGPPGRGGRSITWRYTIVLKETQGTSITFNNVDSSYVTSPRTRVTRKSQAVTLTLPARGELRVPAWDTDWLVVPQGIEGTPRPRNPNGRSTRVFSGTNEGGQPVKLTLEFAPHDVPAALAPPRPPPPPGRPCRPHQLREGPRRRRPPSHPAARTICRSRSSSRSLRSRGRLDRPDASDFPTRFQTFNADDDPRVVFIYLIKTAARVFRLRTDWYDPSSALFETFTRTVDLTRGTNMLRFYTSNVVPTDRMRDFPGTWTVKLAIDGQPAGA